MDNSQAFGVGGSGDSITGEGGLPGDAGGLELAVVTESGCQGNRRSGGDAGAQGALEEITAVDWAGLGVGLFLVI